MMKLFLFVAFITVIVRGEQITGIETGTDYSSCTGYCSNSVLISPSKITTSKTSKTNPDDFPEVQQEYSIGEPSEFDGLVELLGNIQLWKSVDSPVGCADCNYPSSEWAKVYSDEQPPYEVKFEYSTTIPGYESFVSRLQTIRQQYFPIN